MQLPSGDVFIGLIFVFGIAYGMILRRDKTITTLCSVYIGIVIANSFSKWVFDFFNGNATIANQVWIRSNASIPTISIALLLISVFFISGAIHSSGNRSTGDVAPMEVFFYSTLTVALILSTILGFLPEASRIHWVETSRIARIIYNFRTLITILPPIVLIVLNFRRK